MTKRMLELSVSITRNYGKHSIEFGMKEICEIGSGSQRRSAYNNLVSQIEDQVELYETVSLNQVRMPEPETQEGSSLDKVVVLPLVTLSIESKNGKRMMSGKGGQYSKHGVAIYEDTCNSTLDFSSYDYGEHDMGDLDLKMKVDIVDGKPKRVLSIG